VQVAPASDASPAPVSPPPLLPPELPLEVPSFAPASLPPLPALLLLLHDPTPRASAIAVAAAPGLPHRVVGMASPLLPQASPLVRAGLE